MGLYHARASQSLALLTDLYQLTMAYGYWKMKMENLEAVFHLFFRKLPFNGGYVVASGLESVIEFLKDFHFDQSDLDYLATLPSEGGGRLLPDDFLHYLSKFHFSCDVDAVPEGTPVFPYEPILRIKGPIIQGQILESPLLNLINFPSLIATKASRICQAANGDPILEFGLRRAQGVDGALTASRAAFVGGAESTSNVLAGKLFGIPVRGTHSHSWIMAFEEEEASFQAFAESLPDDCVFLVDTYDSIAGIKKAIHVGNWLKENGKKMVGIRLDSGDLAYLSQIAREKLDQAGFQDAVIVASNELDEILISDLKKQGARVAVWGVGTNLVTAKDHPALDGVYKLSAIQTQEGEWKPKLKLSEQMAKMTNPGILQIKRFRSEQGYIADMIYDELDPPKAPYSIIDPLDPTREKQLGANVESQDLLVPVFRKGKLVRSSPSLLEIQAYAQKQLHLIHSATKRFLNPHPYVAGLEKGLYANKVELIRKIRSRIIEDRGL